MTPKTAFVELVSHVRLLDLSYNEQLNLLVLAFVSVREQTESSRVSSLYQSIIRSWLFVLIPRSEVRWQKIFALVMIPILEHYHLIMVVFLACMDLLWSVNDEWSNHAVGILSRVVGMVPVCAILAVNQEIIREATSWWDWALCDARRAIHPVGAILEHPMPVDRCGFIELIRDVDHEAVSAVGTDHWTRELSIDGDHRAEDTCRC